jgi:ubiquinone/menaquinone biosynthesis C-methylase UbiE
MQPQPYLDPRLASVYLQGNEMPGDSLRAWTRLIGSFTPAASPAVLDLGTGTGMFARAMARWRDARLVAAIDQSPVMLAEAARHAPHPRVHYLAGDATALPVRDCRFDLVLVSRVIHHLPDRGRSAAELKRALRPGGTVVVRTTVCEHLDSLVYDYWPELRARDADRFPSLEEITADFIGAGLRPVDVLSFAQPVQPSLRAWRDALALQPQSKFSQLSQADFDAGLHRLSLAATAETSPAEVWERYDVLAFAA